MDYMEKPPKVTSSELTDEERFRQKYDFDEVMTVFETCKKKVDDPVVAGSLTVACMIRQLHLVRETGY